MTNHFVWCLSHSTDAFEAAAAELRRAEEARSTAQSEAAAAALEAEAESSKPQPPAASNQPVRAVARTAASSESSRAVHVRHITHFALLILLCVAHKRRCIRRCAQTWPSAKAQAKAGA
jgi:hypothetical protein